MTIRVMIVDDSVFVRRAVRRMMASDHDLEVVGEAADGAGALAALGALAPDVVTLDLRMPGLDGVETLRAIMAQRPTPVVLLSSFARADAELTLRALAAGAVDFIDKSRVGAMNVYDLAGELVQKVKAAATSQPVIGAEHAPAIWHAAPPAEPPALVILGASTGGAAALELILGGLPGSLPAAVLVVQHMPSGYELALAARLAVVSALPVRPAAQGDPLLPGRVLVARGGHDVRICPGEPPVLRIEGATGRGSPRLDLALESAAQVTGAATCAAVLTGMGQDGAAGARAVRFAGGAVIAEAAATCTVYGMPRAVIEAGAATCVAPRTQIAGVIAGLAGVAP
jgi:two-component system chemotaxis response regulator CheB